jgi:hypothetical protein
MFFLFRRPIWIWILAVLTISLAGTARAINYSVPFVRDGLPYFDANGNLYATGFGATVGEIEVRGSEGNGIDGFDGHRQSGLGPNPGDPGYGQYGFVNVVDFSGSNNPADNYFHGTFVAGIMASEYTSVSDGVNTAPFLGVAPFATYYGAVFDGSGDKAGFLSLNSSLNYVLLQQGASVANNSWGSTVTSASELDGLSATSLLMDEYVGYAGKTGGTTGQYSDKLLVIAAGNNGESGGLLDQPADSYNGLTVGALDAVDPTATGLFDPGRMPADRVAPYSSWAPLANGRAGVDVVAPGTDLWSTLAINYTGTNGLVAGVASGTSFAAPHVTGVAALLYGAAVTPLGGISDRGTILSTDHKLIKAIIMNSADKIPGLDASGNAQTSWQPGEMTTSGGVPNAIVPLNYAVGSGSVNANSAFLEYSEAGNTFWNLNTLAATGTDIYYTFGLGKFTTSDPTQLLSGLTATLVWDRHVDFTVDTSSDPNNVGQYTASLSDLDLILQEEVAPDDWQNVYMSAYTGSTVDQIYLPQLSGTAEYRLDVHGGDIIASGTNGEQYALAVSFTTIPEPGAAWLVIVALISVVSIRRFQTTDADPEPPDNLPRISRTGTDGKRRSKRSV